MSGKFIFICESRDQINEMFYFRQFMSILKFSGKFITISSMLTYDAYVSLGGIEELLLLENLLEASESDESNKPRQKTKSTATYQSRSYLKKEAKNMRNVSLSC